MYTASQRPAVPVLAVNAISPHCCHCCRVLTSRLSMLYSWQDLQNPPASTHRSADSVNHSCMYSFASCIVLFRHNPLKEISTPMFAHVKGLCALGLGEASNGVACDAEVGSATYMSYRPLQLLLLDNTKTSSTHQVSLNLHVCYFCRCLAVVCGVGQARTIAWCSTSLTNITGRIKVLIHECFWMTTAATPIWTHSNQQRETSHARCVIACCNCLVLVSHVCVH